MELELTGDGRIVLLKPQDFANSAQAEELAALHSLCLPESSVALLGTGGLAKAYKVLGENRFEQIYVSLNAEGHITGGAVLSFSPDSIARRLSFHPSLVPYLAIGAARLAWRMYRGTRSSGVSRKSLNSPVKSPEVVWLFVAPGQRRLGLGRRLLAACAQDAESNGFRPMSIYAPNPGDETQAFYRALGFQDQGAAAKRGKNLRLFVLDLGN